MDQTSVVQEYVYTPLTTNAVPDTPIAAGQACTGSPPCERGTVCQSGRCFNSLGAVMPGGTCYDGGYPCSSGYSCINNVCGTDPNDGGDI